MGVVKGRRVPARTAAGTIYGGAGATSVTYPPGRFTVTPVLTMTNLDGGQFPVTSAQSKDGFTYSNVGGSNLTLAWHAVQMTTATAEG